MYFKISKFCYIKVFNQNDWYREIYFVNNVGEARGLKFRYRFI